MWYANVQRNTRLGALLVRRGLISTEQLHHAVALQRDEPSRTLGEILVAEACLSATQLRRCLRRQARLRWFAALAALFCAPVQVMAGGLPTASASAERVAFESARDYADCPQLKLHDAIGRDDGVKQQSVYKAARLLTYMVLDSVWDSMRSDEAEQRGHVSSQGKSLTSTRYTMRLSDEKILLRVNYRF